MCVESSEGTADLAECLVVPATWRPSSEGPGVDPITLALRNHCRASTQNRERLGVTGDRAEDLNCDQLSYETLRCEASAPDAATLLRCAHSAEQRCIGVMKQIVTIITTAEDVPQELKDNIIKAMSTGVSGAMDECVTLSDEVLTCIEKAKNLTDMEGCKVGADCDGLRDSLSATIARDPGLLPRDRQAALRGVMGPEFGRHCWSSPAPLRACLAKADTWQAALTCAAGPP